MSLTKVLKSLIDTINAAGGVKILEDGAIVPDTYEDWDDLGRAYWDACLAVGVRPRISDHHEHSYLDWEEAKIAAGEEWDETFPDQYAGWVLEQMDKCAVCENPEPCSHDFDKENAELDLIAARIGSAYLSGSPDFPVCERSRVVCAAHRRRSDGMIICGARHSDYVIRTAMLAAGGYESWRGNNDQGFIDQFDNFLTREEAHVIAKRHGQILRRCGGDEETLYSENLY